MIEVLFGDSESGAMKYAIKSGKMLSRDVVCLPFMADCGDISKPLTGKYRQRLIAKLLYQEQWGADLEMKLELKKAAKIYSARLELLLTFVYHHEPIRIWYSSVPYSMCGLLWLCSEMEKYSNEVYVVELPRVVESCGNAVSYRSWGEVTPEAFVDFLPLQRQLSPTEIRANALNWKRLQSENAPLRAVINGTVISVPANFYDFLIRKYLTNEPISEAVLIGRILGDNPLGIGDWWYAQRIDKFIKAGKIEIVFDSDKKYERVLRRKKI